MLYPSALAGSLYHNITVGYEVATTATKVKQLWHLLALLAMGKHSLVIPSDIVKVCVFVI